MRTDSEIIEAIKEQYKGEFKSMAIESISTSEADKYGAVKHFVFARTEWNDGTVTNNKFDVQEESDGTFRK